VRCLSTNGTDDQIHSGSQAIKGILTLLAALLLASLAALAEPATADALATFEQRRHAILAAALVQPDKLTGCSPMHFWIAQRLFEQGKRDQALVRWSSDFRVIP
jgi:hypothetical protein